MIDLEIKDGIILDKNKWLFNIKTFNLYPIDKLRYEVIDDKEYLIDRYDIQPVNELFLKENYKEYNSKEDKIYIPSLDDGKIDKSIVSLDTLEITSKTHIINTYLILYLKREFTTIITKKPKEAKAIIKELSREAGAKALSIKKLDQLLTHVGSNVDEFFDWIVKVGHKYVKQTSVDE